MNSKWLLSIYSGKALIAGITGQDGSYGWLCYLKVMKLWH